MVINDTKVSYNDYKKAYLNFASNYAIEGPLSIDTINSIVYYMNSEYLDEETINRLSNCNFLCQDETTSDYIDKAIKEIRDYNINSYYKEQMPIKLSDTIALEEQKEVIMYLERLLENIRKLPQEEAISSYIEIRDIIFHKNTEEYKQLSNKQQKLIESIDLPVADNLFDYRRNAKQFKISQ